MRNCCENCRKDVCAKKVPIFSTLDSCELSEIVDRIIHKEYKKKELIFSEGNKANTLYFVNEGKIKIYKYTKDGKEQILYLLSEGEFFGELNILKESKYGFNAEAIEDCKICTLSKDDLKDLLIKKPIISIKMLEALTERITSVENLVQNIATNDVNSKIAYLLVSLADKYGIENAGCIIINLPMNREDMANYIGITRETLSRKLKKFEEDGLIQIVGTKKIVILNKTELKDYI